MVEAYSPDNVEAQVIEEMIPEDNVERLRNIRDMFENPMEDQLLLQKVERVQPSEKIMQRLSKFNDGLVENEEEFYDEEEMYEDNDISREEFLADMKERRAARRKEKVVPFAELNNVKSKFENMGQNTQKTGPKPPRHITPPRLKCLYEIENTPAERAEGVVGANDKVEDVKIREGLIRSRKLAFANQLEQDNNEKKNQILEDIAPGSTKNAKALFQAQQEDRWFKRLEKIENSGITLEGEIVEKGLAQARLAMFNEEAPEKMHTPSVSEADSEIFQSASGIAKDRMNIFKNLEAQGDNKSKEFKKLKEFTPPPAPLEHQQQQRKYIIIDKETSPSEARNDYNTEEFVPETGLAKNRMKQYLESSQANETVKENKADEIGKGYAKSLLAKWKSMEHMDGKEGSPEPKSSLRRFSKEGSPGSVDCMNQDELLIEQGHARNLRNKWQNIDSNSESTRRAPRQITPPPSEDLQRNKNMFEAPQESQLNKTVNNDQELNLIGRGHAKNTLAKFQQSVNESTSHVRKTVTPPRDYINKALGDSAAQSVYESNPVDSCINSQFCEEEVIPSAGHARNLKNKFLNLEKEAAKVETSSSKMNYKPKKFTSSAAPQSNSSSSQQVKQVTQVKKIDAARLAEVAAGPEKPRDTSAKDAAVNEYLKNHTSTLHGGDKCCICSKTVYAMEKIEADKNIYHKSCFKCTVCECTLNEDNYTLENGNLFCFIHSTKTPVSPAKSNASSQKSPVKGLQSIHIDTASSFDSDTASMKSPDSFSPISPLKGVKSPKKSPMKSPKSTTQSPKKH